ncbi:MAG: amidohydrolase family protein [Flavobacteriales bacterium]
MKNQLLLFVLLIQFSGIYAQEYFPKNDGVKQENTPIYVFTNATIYQTPNQVIKKGTLVIQNQRIISVGKNVTIPQNAIITNLDGKYIYPSFIEIYSNFGVEKPKKAAWKNKPQYDASRSGFYWNDHIKPEQKASDFFKYDSKKATTLRKAGFGTVNSHQMDGIARGTGILIALNDDDDNSVRIINDQSGQFFSFKKSITSRQSYPTSLMGSIALLKQMYYDQQWYEKGLSKTKDRSLEALISNKNQPSFFEAGDKLNDLRADKLGDLFNLDYIIVGGGDEYENIQNIKNSNAAYIIPINFPDAYDVSNPYATKYITLAEMRDWNQAPSNPKKLTENNITFALTTHQLKNLDDFKKKLIKAIKYGFSKTKALEALTTIPAKMLGKENELGSLKTGYYANFLITSDKIFEPQTIIYENWVQGTKNVINDKDQKDIRGNYTFTTEGKKYKLTVSGKPNKINSEIQLDTLKYNSKISYKNNWITFSFNDNTNNKTYRAAAIITDMNKDFTGKIILPNGLVRQFTAIWVSNLDSNDQAKEENKENTPKVLPISYPNIGYGFKQKPIQQNILFKNATVWTGEKEGILKNNDVLIKNGKIAKIGKNLASNGAKIIDATGKHLTAGIIDEHSHIATVAINESGHNSSAEVSIADVINPEDISIYRNLAGGVTTIQILHGSANPIGGQSALIKLKWSENADGLLYKNAAKFIKFALGENVKQSNWGDQNNIRFPQTRMGVEQVYINYFNRAKEYDTKKKSGQAYRYDLELETLAEILNKERFITCHSYIQSEIIMLMRVAEKFNFRINTFTHILEGYKVADKMKKHGAGASTFSDWWAYKYEVNDAIPYNATILNNMGITVAINSDDAEMSRRLNQEAAKSVKYGGMSEEDAWKMVTINPAKLLHIDNKVGSIKIGKDADVVLWSEHPLSVYAKAEKTIIEGTIYFDIEKDKQQRVAIEQERNQLITMMLQAKNAGAKTQKPIKKVKKVFTCETIH